MKRILFVLALLVGSSSAHADDNKTVIINGPVIILGDGNIVQIGNNNKVVVKDKRLKPSRSSVRPSNTKRSCDHELMRHNAQVARWLKMMGR